MSSMKTVNKKVAFRPDAIYLKHPSAIARYENQTTMMSAPSFRNTANIPRRSPSPRKFSMSAGRFLRQVGAKVAKALRLVPGGRKKKWSPKVSSSSAAVAALPRSWSYAESSTLDSQKAEAIEDCIEFLNSSSSSLQRSFSTRSCSSS